MVRKFKFFDNNKLLYLITVLYIILAFFIWKKMNENYELRAYHFKLSNNFYQDYSRLHVPIKGIFIKEPKFNTILESIIDSLRYRSQFISYSIRNEVNKLNLCNSDIEISIGKEHQIRFENVYILNLKAQKTIKNQLFNECVKNYTNYINDIYNLMLLKHYKIYRDVNIDFQNSENQIFFSKIKKLLNELENRKVEMVIFKLKNIQTNDNIMFQIFLVFFIISIAYLYLIISIKNRKLFDFNKLIIKKLF